MSSKVRNWSELSVWKQSFPGRYTGMAVNSEGLLAVADSENRCISLIRNGSVQRFFGKEVLRGDLRGIAFDQEGNVWVASALRDEVLKFSKDGSYHTTIKQAGDMSIKQPTGVSVSPEGLVYICDSGNRRVTVHDEDGKFLFAFRSKECGQECFDEPRDVTFGSDGLVYVTDRGNSRVCVWSSKERSFRRDFSTKYSPIYIAATGDNHLLITSCSSNTVMVYTLGGQLVHEFRGSSSDPDRAVLKGICVDGSEAVYVADWANSFVYVF